MPVGTVLACMNNSNNNSINVSATYTYGYGYLCESCVFKLQVIEAYLYNLNTHDCLTIGL